MSRNKFENFLEDYGTSAVPVEKRLTWLHLGLVIWGINICLPAFFLGSLLAQKANTLNAILSLFFGTLILTVLASGTGYLGTKTRRSLALSIQTSFGKKGQWLLALIIALTSIGWFAIQLEIFSLGFHKVIQTIFEKTDLLSQTHWIIIGGSLMSTTAIFGMKALDKLSIIAIPLLIIVMLTPFVLLQDQMTFSNFSHKTPHEISLGTLITTIIGAMSVGTILLPDVTRYAKSTTHSLGGVFFGMMIGFPLPLLATYLLLVGLGQSNLLTAWLMFPSAIWGGIVLLAVILATWTTNDNNLYSASLALNSIFPGTKKWKLTILCGFLGSIIAYLGILQHLGYWLQLLAVAIPPIGAILIYDWIIDPLPETSKPEQLIQKPVEFNISAWFSWFIGVSTGLLSFFKWIPLTNIPSFDAMIFTFLVCFLLRRLQLT